jgi:ABC-type antimicrobial peptide transport system permease subunit
MDAVNPFGEIIGVVGDVKEGALSKAPSPTVYYAHANLISAGMTLVVRTNTDPLAVVPSIRKIMRDLDPTVPLAEVRTMETILAETYARERFSAILLISFSLAAALLAAIGIYGVLAWAVQEQTREIGVRLALGATTNRVMGMVLGAAARFVTAGIIVGLAGAFIASKSIESLLFGVPARDPLAFSLAPATILLVAAVATLIPARKAATTDPIQALR